MRISERLRQLSNQGIEIKEAKDTISRRGKKRGLVQHEDGIEFIVTDLGRKYRKGDKGYTAMRRILENQGVPSRRLDEIRTDLYVVQHEDGISYKFHYPTDDYKYLTERSEQCQ